MWCKRNKTPDIGKQLTINNSAFHHTIPPVITFLCITPKEFSRLGYTDSAQMKSISICRLLVRELKQISAVRYRGTISDWAILVKQKLSLIED